VSTVANPLWNPWANDRKTLALYRRRCREESEEMTCAAQAAEILAEHIRSSESLLDAGCGGGYYYHSFRRRNLPVEYEGLDYTPEMIDLARAEVCPRTGLPPERYQLCAIEDLDREFDNVICFNVLTNSAHYALPLDRLLRCTRKRLLLRESLSVEHIVRYTPDLYLDEGKQDICVYHNTYSIEEVSEFIAERGFKVTRIRDRRSGDGIEMVVDIPHFWRILLAERA
jgi:SAM-dependent methyltransferase